MLKHLGFKSAAVATFLFFTVFKAAADDGKSTAIFLGNNPTKNYPSADLICSKPSCVSTECGVQLNKILTAVQTQCLIDKKILHDSSELDPAGDSIQWSGDPQHWPYLTLWTQIFQFPTAAASKNEVGLNDSNETMEYGKIKKSAVGKLNISTSLVDSNNQTQSYSVQFGPKAHNILMRRTLLRKLGYYVPPVQYLKTFNLKFSGQLFAGDESLFLSGFKNTFMDAKKWVLNLEDYCQERDGTGSVTSEKLTQTYNQSTKKYESTGQSCRPCLKDPKTNQCVTNSESTSGTRIVNKTDTLQIKDVVIYKGADDNLYNFARGEIDNRAIGRRLFNALIIPYYMTDFEPEVNFTPWTLGSIINNNVVLPYEYGDEFQTTLDDTKWIIRRIQNLRRSDLEDVVASAEFPPEVSALMVEKLISIRDSAEQMILPKEIKNLPFNNKVSSGSVLKDGLLKASPWPDFAIDFYNTDLDNPKSPLAPPEILAFGEEKSIANTISNVVAKFNSKYISGTNIGKDKVLHQVDLEAQQFADFLKTGKPSKIPLGFWADKFWAGGIIASRDIVIGSYLGTDNGVQMADTVGFNLGAGYYVNVDGLKANQTAFAVDKVYTTWTYTHVKPTTDIKTAVREPFKNILVPLIKHDGTFLIDELLQDNVEIEIQKTKTGFDIKKELANIQSTCGDFNRKQTDLETYVKTVFDKLTTVLGPGESLIVQKNFGNLIDVDYIQQISIPFQAQLRFFDDLKSIHRIHIYRKDTSTFQIFRTPAALNTLGLSVGLSSYFYNIINLGKNWNNTVGDTTKVNFFTVNVDTDLCKNSKFFDNIAGLSHVFKTGDTKPLTVLPIQDPDPANSGKTIGANFQPYVISHHMDENETTFNLNLGFWGWQHFTQKMFDVLNVSYPTGFKEDLLLRSTGARSGVNVQDASIQLANALIKKYGNPEIQVSSQGNGNPADTIFGHSFSKRGAFQSNLADCPQNKNGDGTVPKGCAIDGPYSSVEYQWRGWSLNRDKLLKLVDGISNKWGKTLCPPQKFQFTKKVLLFNLYNSISIYKDGIDHMANATQGQVYSDFIHYHTNVNWFLQNYRVDRFAEIFIKSQQKYLAAQNSDPEAASDAALDMITNAENHLTHEGFEDLIGGVNNMYIQVTMDGYKEGDPNGMKQVVCDAAGQVGSIKIDGPLNFVMRFINMNAGEFYIYWLINKL